MRTKIPDMDGKPGRPVCAYKVCVAKYDIMGQLVEYVMH